ncbi:cell division protein [Escherichia coli]|nr:cell division protein [Escherichia coli]
MGKLTLLLLAILVWLQYSLWFGKNGIHDYTRVNDDVRHSKLQTRNLKRETINFLPKLTISMAARRRSKSVRVMNSA